MRVLVVGGTGFVGSHVVDALLAAGHAVRVLAPAPELFRPPLADVDYRAAAVEPGASLAAHLDGCDAVVDAAMTAPARGGDAVAAVTTPLAASLWLAEQAALAGVEVHCVLSSAAVYGHGAAGRAVTEADLPAPINAYGAAKAAIELALPATAGESRRVSALRIANVYGERQDPSRPQGLVGIAMDRLHTGRPLTVFGDMVRDFVHVRDVAAAVELAVGRRLVGNYNVAGGTGVPITDLLDRLVRLTGRELRIERAPARDGEILHSVLDPARLRAQGWAPRIGLEDGLRRTWQWYRATVEG